MEVIGAGQADVPRAEIAPIPIVARAPVDALGLLPALVHRSAVIDPVDQGLGGRRNRIPWVLQHAGHDVLKGGAEPWRGILPRTKLSVGDGISQVARDYIDESDAGVGEA